MEEKQTSRPRKARTLSPPAGPQLPAQSVDLVLCDLPYGMTAFEWDKVITMGELWEQYKRVLKPCGLAVLFASQRFAIDLATAARPYYKYSLTWVKNYPTNPQNAKYQPLRRTEQIMVFEMPREGNHDYFAQTRGYLMEERKKCGLSNSELMALLGTQMVSHYFTHGGQFILPHEEAYTKLQSTGFFTRPYGELRALYEQEKTELPQLYPTYNPQGLKPCTRHRIKHKHSGHAGFGTKLCAQDTVTYKQEFTGYPDDLLYFDMETAQGRLHPSQKPVALLEWLIRTYSNAGETVLDNCMGSGSTGVACLKTGRRFVGMELDPRFFELAQSRIGAAERMELKETEHGTDLR